MRRMLGRHMDLVAQLADEADAQHARRHAGDVAFAHAEVGKCRLGRAHRRSAGASTSRERGPARFIAAMAPVRLTMPHSRPHMRVEPLQLPIDDGRAGGRGGEVEVLLATAARPRRRR